MASKKQTPYDIESSFTEAGNPLIAGQVGYDVGSGTWFDFLNNRATKVGKPFGEDLAASLAKSADSMARYTSQTAQGAQQNALTALSKLGAAYDDANQAQKTRGDFHLAQAKARLEQEQSLQKQYIEGEKERNKILLELAKIEGERQKEAAKEAAKKQEKLQKAKTIGELPAEILNAFKPFNIDGVSGLSYDRKRAAYDDYMRKAIGVLQQAAPQFGYDEWEAYLEERYPFAVPVRPESNRLGDFAVGAGEGFAKSIVGMGQLATAGAQMAVDQNASAIEATGFAPLQKIGQWFREGGNTVLQPVAEALADSSQGITNVANNLYSDAVKDRRIAAGERKAEWREANPNAGFVSEIGFDAADAVKNLSVEDAGSVVGSLGTTALGGLGVKLTRGVANKAAARTAANTARLSATAAGTTSAEALKAIGSKAAAETVANRKALLAAKIAAEGGDKTMRRAVLSTGIAASAGDGTSSAVDAVMQANEAELRKHKDFAKYHKQSGGDINLTRRAMAIAAGRDAALPSLALAAGFTFLPGSSEGIIANHLSKTAGGVGKRSVRKTVGKAALSALNEAAEEAAMQYLSNVYAQDYAPDSVHLADGLGKSLVLGGLAGGSVGGISAGLNYRNAGNAAKEGDVKSLTSGITEADVAEAAQRVLDSVQQGNAEPAPANIPLLTGEVLDVSSETQEGANQAVTPRGVNAPVVAGDTPALPNYAPTRNHDTNAESPSSAIKDAVTDTAVQQALVNAAAAGNTDIDFTYEDSVTLWNQVRQFVENRYSGVNEEALKQHLAKDADVINQYANDVLADHISNVRSVEEDATLDNLHNALVELWLSDDTDSNQEDSTPVLGDLPADVEENSELGTRQEQNQAVAGDLVEGVESPNTAGVNTANLSKDNQGSLFDFSETNTKFNIRRSNVSLNDDLQVKLPKLRQRLAAVQNIQTELHKLSPKAVAMLMSDPSRKNVRMTNIVKALGFGTRVTSNTKWGRTVMQLSSRYNGDVGTKVLKSIVNADNSEVGALQKEIAKQIINLFEKSGVPLPTFTVAKATRKNQGGSYSYQAHKVKVVKDAGGAQAINHEYIHALTVPGLRKINRTLNNPLASGAAKAKAQQTFDIITALHSFLSDVAIDTVKTNPSNNRGVAKTPYGLRTYTRDGRNTPSEMFAELVNPDFMQLVSKLSVADLIAHAEQQQAQQQTEQSRSVWQRIVDSIKAWFKALFGSNKGRATFADNFATWQEAARNTDLVSAYSEIIQNAVKASDALANARTRNKDTGTVAFGQTALDQSIADVMAMLSADLTDIATGEISRITKNATRGARELMNVENAFAEESVEESLTDYSAPEGAIDLTTDMFTDPISDLESSTQEKSGTLSDPEVLLDALENNKEIPVATATSRAKEYLNAEGRKRKAIRKNAINTARQKIIETVFDALQPVQNWLNGMANDGVITERTRGEGAYRLHQTAVLRDALLHQAKNHGYDDLTKALHTIATKTGMSEGRALYEAGMWVTANYAPQASANLIRRLQEGIAKRTKQIEDMDAQLEKLNEQFISVAENIANLSRDREVQRYKGRDVSEINRLLREQYKLRNKIANQIAPNVNNSLASRRAAEMKALRKDTNSVTKMQEALAEKRIGKASYKLGGGMNVYTSEAIKKSIESRIPVENLKEVQKAIGKMMAYRLAMDIEYGRTMPEVAARFLNKPQVLPLLNQLKTTAEAFRVDAEANMQMLNELRQRVMQEVENDYVPMDGDAKLATEVELFGRLMEDKIGYGTGRAFRMEGSTKLPRPATLTALSALTASATHAGFSQFTQYLTALYNKLSPEQRADYGIHATRLKNYNDTPLNSVIARHNGQAVAFTFEDSSIFDAFRKNNIEAYQNIFERSLVAATRKMSWFMTQGNIGFIKKQLATDMAERITVLAGHNLFDAEGNKLDSRGLGLKALARYAAGGFARYYANAAQVAFGRDTQDTSPALQKKMKFLLDNGYVSTHASMFSHDQTELEKLVRQHNISSRLLNAGKKSFETVNNSIEYTSLLAVFDTLTDAGMDWHTAGRVTLDTMNYRKKGSASGWVASMYAFTRPALTGAMNFSKVMFDHNGNLKKGNAAYFAATTLAFVVLSSMASAAAGDDEGGDEIKQLGRNSNNRYLEIPIGNGEFFRVPLGYGFMQIAKTLANHILAASRGEESAGEAVWKTVTEGLIPNLSPISSPEIDASKHPFAWFALTFAPTLSIPLVELVGNRDSFGRNIVKKQNYEKDTEFRYLQHGENVAPFWRDMAKMVSSMLPVDIAPEEVRHLVQGYFNGIIGEPFDYVDKQFAKSEGKFVQSMWYDPVYYLNRDGAIQSQFYKWDTETSQLLSEQNADPREFRRKYPASSVEQRLLRIRAEWDEAEKDFTKRKSEISKLPLKEEAKRKRKAQLRDEQIEVQRKIVYKYRIASGLAASHLSKQERRAEQERYRKQQ